MMTGLTFEAPSWNELTTLTSGAAMTEEDRE